MIKDQFSQSASPVAIIELTDEELEGMRGGCDDDNNGDWGSDSDNRRRSWRSDDGGDWDGNHRFSFRGHDRRW